DSMTALQQGGLRPPPEQLGTLLVRRGVITPEQLAAALEEQQTTRKPLGEIIVTRGFAPGPMVAQALATQHGGLLKTEYGFATGFGPLDGAPPATGAVAAPPADDPRVAQLAADREAVRAELELASAEAVRLTEDNERLAGLRAELEQRLAHESRRAASLEA